MVARRSVVLSILLIVYILHLNLLCVVLQVGVKLVAEVMVTVKSPAARVVTAVVAQIVDGMEIMVADGVVMVGQVYGFRFTYLITALLLIGLKNKYGKFSKGRPGSYSYSYSRRSDDKPLGF